MLYLWELISKMKPKSPKLNCSIFFPLYCLIVSKKTIRRMHWEMVLMVQYLSIFFRSSVQCLHINTFFCGFAFACDLAAITLTLVFDVRSSCGSAITSCIVVIWIEHVFVSSKRYSDPRLRIILTHRPDSNFNHHVCRIENWLWLVIQVQFSWIHLSCEAGSSRGRVYSRQTTERNCLKLPVSWVTRYCPPQQYAQILLPYRIYSLCFVVKTIQFSFCKRTSILISPRTID